MEKSSDQISNCAEKVKFEGQELNINYSPAYKAQSFTDPVKGEQHLPLKDGLNSMEKSDTDEEDLASVTRMENAEVEVVIGMMKNLSSRGLSCQNPLPILSLELRLILQQIPIEKQVVMKLKNMENLRRNL